MWKLLKFIIKCVNANKNRKVRHYVTTPPTTTSDILMKVIDPHPIKSSNKITVIGVGKVGMACAIGILAKGLTNHLCLIDHNDLKLRGEMLDLQHSTHFIKKAKIEASTDCKIAADSKLCIITVGVRQRLGESRLELVQRNAEVMNKLIPDLVKYTPKTMLVVATNPVDVITYICWKVSKFPQNRVIGSGTNLDSARFRFLIADKLGVASTSVHGYIIGEHGDTSVPIWSGVNVCGIKLSDINTKIGTDEDTEHWYTLHQKVVDSAYEVIKCKGYTSWAIGFSVAELCAAILNNSLSIHPVSTNLKGLHNIQEEVFLSLPVVLAANGISKVILQNLSQDELTRLQNSATALQAIQSELQL